MRAAVIALLVGLLPGCGLGCHQAAREPKKCVRAAAGDAGFTPLDPRMVTMGTGRGASFAPYAPGGDVALVSGGQGALMIMPVVRAPADGATSTCWGVHIVNTLPGTAEMPQLRGDFAFQRDGDFLYTDALFDQLSYLRRTMLVGRPLTLALTVTGPTASAAQTIEVVPR